MVMVANKKTQKQMDDDLNLFLGPNTTKFTTWLVSRFHLGLLIFLKFSCFVFIYLVKYF
ncbi:hypothetical protein HELRODRAFT_82696 [Helobdella robusta]|uniref:Uncharacterized protein n=1 Tax=Helobdella robusta TaxID=6412 RepID=T1G4V5_HELRO|nr:hypothetical protein HELRODRAFT_82696 [Helobdella robusta]ESO00782.1 hypothetical protein HELRODRAFT_82696 [Helobdella robusta]